MALTSLTVVADASFVNGNKKERVVDIVFGSYVTGGETVSPAQVGLTRIDQAILHSNPRSAAGTAISSVGVDYATIPGSVKLQTYLSAAAGSPDAEVANATSLSAFSARFTFLGT